MHARHLLQIATSVVSHAQVLAHARTPFPQAAIEQYWVASRCQQEAWSRALKDFSVEHQQLPVPRDHQSSWILPVMEECLTVEVFSRVWSAVCALVDSQCGTSDASTVVRGALDGHRGIRDRLLNLLVYGRGLKIAEAVTVNCHRVRCERWTDTLLAWLGAAASRSEWAFEPYRVRRLAAILRQHDTARGANLPKALLLAAVQHADWRSLSPHPFTPDWNRQIAGSVIACLPPQIFDATGQLISAQQLWMWNSSSDSCGWLNLVQDRPTPAADETNGLPQAAVDPRVVRRFDLH